MKKAIVMNDFDILDGFIWFIHTSYNCIVKYDIVRNKAFYESYIPEEYKGKYTYKSLFADGKTIVIIPNQSNFILIYDISGKKFSKIEVSTEKYKYGYFRLGKRIDNYIYLMPSQYEYVCKYDMNTNNLVHLFNWKLIRKNYSKDSYICDASIQDNKYASFIVKPQNDIVILSLTNTDDYYVIKGDDGANYTTLCSINNYIYIRDEKRGEIIVIDNDQRKIIERKKDITDDLYYLYSYKNEYLMIDEITNPRMTIFDENLNKCYEYNSDNESNEEYCYLEYTDKLNYKGEAIWFSNSSSELVFINNEFIGKTMKIYIDEEDNTFRENLLLNCGIIEENGYINLDDFIQVCKNY